MTYNFKEIQKKWSDSWAKKEPFKTKPTGTGKKYYVLDMFPYPSGSGLHVGHWRGYVLSDVYARQKALEGYNVLHPMGWDAFGLPAENAAIKEGVHPKESTERNIANFKHQLKDIAALYDWDKEV
ncbi:MAG: class I tRNA ligase family protein, partial [Candidatus Babeliales bacterium]